MGNENKLFKKFQSRRYVSRVFHFSHFFKFTNYFQKKKHAIGFKPELKIAQPCKKSLKIKINFFKKYRFNPC
jgi:hypothetical protein